MKKALLVSSIGVLLLAGFCLSQAYLPVSPEPGTEQLFAIQLGEGLKEISQNLSRAGLIRSPLAFQVFVLLAGSSKKLQAGSYWLSDSLNAPEMVTKFVSGDVAKEKITLVEGWGISELANLLRDKNIIKDASELFAVTGRPADPGCSENIDLSGQTDFAPDFAFLGDKPQNRNLEGYLFPDTYEISLDDDVKTIVEKILTNFDSRLTPQLRTEIARQDKSVFEVVTMASLLEKEVQTLEDKKLVAGILWKRLDSGMRLQVDATVNYVLPEKSVQTSYEQTQICSPYNTYRSAGLPWGPIANPGQDSLLAAIYPKASPYWYYLSTPSGQTLFSQTLEEHNIKKVKYLK